MFCPCLCVLCLLSPCPYCAQLWRDDGGGPDRSEGHGGRPGKVVCRAGQLGRCHVPPVRLRRGVFEWWMGAVVGVREWGKVGCVFARILRAAIALTCVSLSLAVCVHVSPIAMWRLISTSSVRRCAMIAWCC